MHHAKRALARAGLLVVLTPQQLARAEEIVKADVAHTNEAGRSAEDGIPSTLDDAEEAGGVGVGFDRKKPFRDAWIALAGRHSYDASRFVGGWAVDRLPLGQLVGLPTHE